MSEQQNDKLLDKNLARLLSRGSRSPTLSPEAESRIITQLQSKQAELVSQKDHAMETSVTLPTSPQSSAKSWAMAATALLAVAGLVLVAAFMFSNPHGGQPQSAIPAPVDPEAPQVAISGLARKVLEDGTSVIARKGAKYAILGPRQIRLEQGDLYLIVAKSDKPFLVTTADGTVRATGTRFAVSVGSETSTAVSQGRVTLSNESDEVELRAGQQGTMRKGERPQRQPAKRLSYLVNWAKEALSQDELLVEKKASDNGLVAIDPWGQETKLTLRKYNVDVHIEDGIARTTIDQTFFNHYPWNTEGTFYFPLPPDASVSRLAMYVNGQLNEGGMVERARGQQIYTDILYQNRDPALLEMMEGNVFKMRIFPLEGRQEKRIFLSYTQKLEELYGTLRYWFPMDHSNSVANQLSIRVRVKDAADHYDFESSTHKLAAKNDGGDLVLEYEAEKVKPDQDLLLHLTSSKSEQSNRVATCEKSGHKFISARFTPKIPGEVSPKARQWIILNDVSASRSNIEIKAQRYIVERLLSEADDDDSLTILNLNTQVERATHDFAKYKSLVPVKELRAVGFETKPTDSGQPVYVWPAGKRLGGTNLSAGIEAVAKIIADEKPENPHILYVGDGVATDGRTEVFSLVRAIPRGATFVGIGVGKKVDALFLQSAADQTGGMFTTINPDEDIDWRVFDLIAALNTPRVTKILVSLKDKDGQELPVGKTIAYPSSRSLADGETLTIVARCEDNLPAKIVCEGQTGTEKFRFESSLDHAKPNAEFIPRLWAKRHIDELTKSDMERENEIIELSKQYYVVTPFTSLIVLEDDGMYEQYKVERGRKDHWALYPAPKTIEVVKEPVDWNRWNWYGYGPGEDAKIEAVAKPKSVREIVDGVQFRINAPFYHWRPQQEFGGGRHALYQLLDSEADPTRLLAYWYLLAAGAEDAAAGIRPGTSDGSPTSASSPVKPPPPSNKPMPVQQYYSVVTENFARPSLSTFDVDLDAIQPAFARYRTRGEYAAARMSGRGTELLLGLALADETRPILPQLIEDRRSLATPLLGGLDYGKKGKLLPSMPLTNLWGDHVSLDDQLPVSGLSPELLQSFQTELGRRWSRINSDIRNFNRQYGHWDGWGEWGGSSSIDLGQSASARWYGGLEGLMGDFENEESAQLALLPTLVARESGEPLPAQMLVDQQGPVVAWLSVYSQSIRTQPGTCSVLAADYLLKRRSELSGESLTPERKRELEAIEHALANLDKASARLEDSSPFWGWQGWNYRPQVWSFQQPTVQVYHNYNWSFDLTRYAPGLYSTSFDILNEVIDEYSVGAARQAAPGITVNSAADDGPARQAGPTSDVSDRARQFISQARAAIKPVKIRYEQDGQELLVAAGDRFAMTRRTDMYLEERIVCDGESVLQFYDEIGLASRRPATNLRLAALRQLAPHIVESAESLASRFNVDASAKAEDDFELRLTPLVQPEDATQQYVLTVHVAADGRIRSKVLTVGDEKRLLLTFVYKGDKITARWFNKDDKELAEFTYTAEPLTDVDNTFSVDLSGYVVFDMPLRKPSYYVQQLESLDGEDDDNTRINLKRHHALASIQELHWRRWGGTNSEAQKSLTEAFELMKKNGVTARLGDLTLLGSAGVYNTWNVLTSANMKLAPGLDETHAVSRYFKLRQAGVDDAVKLRGDQPDGFIGHLAAYMACATWNKLTEHYDIFTKRFPESPLLLAATFYTSNWGNQPEAWQKLYDHPRWRMLAIYMSASNLKTDEQRQELAAAFVRMHDELVQEGYDVPLTAQVAAIVKQHAGESWKRLTSGKLERVKESEHVAPLLHFAEQAMSWGATSLADEAISLARERLDRRAGSVRHAEKALLERFALAQVYWAGSRVAEALKLYDEVLAALDKDGISASPAMLASAARLAQQAGDHGRAIAWEEQALAAEHPYLPELINLQAFRQRYSWLWQQYQAKVAEAVLKGDQDAVGDWLSRAEATWLRWHEVDPDNFSMMQQMATLQTTAGRNDDAWLYLSTMIDQRPRDASSYYNVGQWYRGQSNLDEAQQWYARAYEWDTANPRWLFERAQLLDQLDRKLEARKLYEQVVEGQWAPGLQGYVNQAKSALSP